MKNSGNTIKTFGSLFIAIVVMTAFSSCSNYMSIEKRHYRSGYYVSKSKADVKSENKIASVNTFSEKEIPAEVKSISENSVKQDFIPNTVVTMNTVSEKSNSIQKKPLVQSVKTEQKEKMLSSKSLTVKAAEKNSAKDKKNKPETGEKIWKGMMIFLITCLALFIGCIVAFVIAFATSSWGTGAFI